MIENNKVVSIEYSVKDKETLDLIDSNVDGKPLDFLMGASQVIIGLEKALLGKSIGDKMQVEVQPEDAYGVHRVDFLQEVPREQFEGIELKNGMTLFGQGEHGETVQVIVRDFNEKVVMIDYNHPLAGKTLIFDVTILDVRDATEQEILNGGVGMSGGCGCHDHGDDHHGEGGGCCGGGCGCH
ncbi:FKBP-type peptidyl-prolyl cis-trans isomerase [Helicobacter anatolicus]|uniref:FKBP-type peptidyl-prolyl cis-trans isomerase n=1 Tax=Helicobacter anatolicus TaxID=2905874 RepID=UPI001E2AC4FD|nr:peptidylprolyl isomerase [Helicobacter anatolicus]MCE3039826.1 peptidylprolyl isomerase [Helicobacter anatolicus]